MTDASVLERAGQAHSNSQQEAAGRSPLDGEVLARRFHALDPAGQQRFLSALEARGMRFDRLPIVALNSPDREPLAPAQQRLWSLYRLQPANSAYHLVGAFLLGGNLDSARLMQAIEAVAQRHAILRTRFGENDAGDAWQRIDSVAMLAFESRNVATLDPVRQQDIADRHATQPFDLGREQPLRVQLLQLDASSWRLQLVMHHLVSDGWSIDVLLHDVMRAYETDAALEPTPVQYIDYARWQRVLLDSNARRKDLAWWREQLGQQQPPLLIEHHRSVSATALRPAERQQLSLNVALDKALRSWANRIGISLPALLLAAWKLTLARHSSRQADPVATQDMSIGVPVANRDRPELAPLIGFFVNTLVIRSRLAPTMSIREFTRAVHGQLLDAREHQALPFDQLVEEIAPSRQPGETPFFQVLFNHRQSSDSATGTLQIDGLNVTPLLQALPHALFDLALDADAGTGLSLPGDSSAVQLTLTWASDRIDAATARQLLQDLPRVLQLFVDEPDRALGTCMASSIKSSTVTADNTTTTAATVTRTTECEAEWVLLPLCRQLLGTEHAQRDDGFFALGGDSIQALQLISRAREAGWVLQPVDVLEASTLAQMAAQAQPAPPAHAGPQALPTEAFDLLPIQAHFFGLAPSVPSHWNQHLWLALAEPLDTWVLAQALSQVVAHHDALRLQFVQRAEGWQQQYLPGRTQAQAAQTADGVTSPTDNSLLHVAHAQDEDEVEALCQATQESLDIATGKLLRALYVTCTGQADRLLLVIHHLAIDGVSWRIVLEDLWRTCRQLNAEQPVELPPVSASLAELQQQLARWADTDSARSRLSFWQKQTPMPALELAPMPARQRSQPRYGQCQRHRHSLSLVATDSLLHETPDRLGVSVQSLLTSALATALAGVSDQTEVCLNMEAHGRHDAVFQPLDTSRSVGWMTSLFPLRLTLGDELGQSLQTIHRQISEAGRDGGISFGALGFLAGSPLAPEAPVTFNYLGRYTGNDFDHWFSVLPGGGLPQAADNPMLSPLIVNAQIIDERLDVQWEYASSHYGEPDIIDLAMQFEASLHGLLDLPAPPSAAWPASGRPDRRLLAQLGGQNSPARVNMNRHAPGSTDQVAPADTFPLFCMHPVTGRVHGYQYLADQLGNDLPVIGIHSRSTLEADWFDSSLGDMAERYCATIREQQPSGPYRLLGWSLGGTLALEIAARLSAQGQAIAFLGLLDAYVPGFEILADQWPSFELRQKLDEQLAVLLPDVPDASRANWLNDLQTLRPAQWPDSVDRWLTGASGSPSTPTEAGNARELIHAWAIEQHLRMLCQGYMLPTVDTPVDAWWATRPIDQMSKLTAAMLAIGPLRSSQGVDTDHLSIVRDPGVIDALRQRLQQLA